MALRNRDQTRGLEFQIGVHDDGSWPRDSIMCVVLMDIRDELQRLNRLLHCQNFQEMPTKLRQLQTDVAFAVREARRRKTARTRRKSQATRRAVRYTRAANIGLL